MVTQMTIPEKINALQSCVAKCEDVEYSIQAKLGDNKEQELGEIRNIISNGRMLFISGQIQNLDYETREHAFHTWNELLDKKLSLFPEYALEEEEVVSMAR